VLLRTVLVDLQLYSDKKIVQYEFYSLQTSRNFINHSPVAHAQEHLK
jgi:hypothetical protein